MDEDILELLKESAPENVEDLQTVEQLVDEISNIYQEMKTAIEAEKKEKLEKLKKAMVKQIIALFEAGYTLSTVREILRRLNVKEKDIDEFVTDAWAEMERRKRWGPWLSLARVILILGVIAGLVVAGYFLMKQSSAVYCSSYMCTNEILKCKPGKYQFRSGENLREISIDREGNQCIVRFVIRESQNRSEVGKQEVCRFQIYQGLTDMTDKSRCTGYPIL